VSVIRICLAVSFVLIVLVPALLVADPSPISVELSTHTGVRAGDTLQLCVLMQSPRMLGGIDFRIHFADSIFQFVSVAQDTGLRNWEWFSSSHDATRATVRIMSIADLPYPPALDPADFYPAGSVARIRFVVLPAWNQDSSTVPFRFFWGSCGDNACSNVTGDTLLIIRRLLDDRGQLIWDETDNVQFPESIRPPNVGVPDTCLQTTAGLLNLLDFRNGSANNYRIPGDADGNSLVNVSDAVYLISFIFSSGPAPMPLSAGDVNCDGLANISDAVYLITYVFSGGTPPAACY